MSAQAGWYPDPGGVPNLYRYWDGQVWSAATTPNPQAPPPTQGLIQGIAQSGGPGQGPGGQTAGQNPYGAYGQGQYGSGSGQNLTWSGFPALVGLSGAAQRWVTCRGGVLRRVTCGCG